MWRKYTKSQKENTKKKFSYFIQPVIIENNQNYNLFINNNKENQNINNPKVYKKNIDKKNKDKNKK